MTINKREYRDIATAKIKPYANNPKVHKQEQIERIADSIQAYGWGDPILVTPSLVVIAGHGRLDAAQLLEMPKVPCCILHGLTDEEESGLRIADNRIGEDSQWSVNRLFVEFQKTTEVPTGFSEKEVHDILSADTYGQDPPISPKPFPVKNGEVWDIDDGRILLHVTSKWGDPRVCAHVYFTSLRTAAEHGKAIAESLNREHGLLVAFSDPHASVETNVKQTYATMQAVKPRQLLTSFLVAPDTSMTPAGESIMVFGAPEQTHWRLWQAEGSEPQINAAYQSIYVFATTEQAPLTKLPRVKSNKTIITHGHVFMQHAPTITDKNANLLLEIISKEDAPIVVRGLPDHTGLLLAITRRKHRSTMLFAPAVNAEAYLKECRDRMLLRVAKVDDAP